VREKWEKLGEKRGKRVGHEKARQNPLFWAKSAKASKNDKQILKNLLFFYLFLLDKLAGAALNISSDIQGADL